MPTPQCRKSNMARDELRKDWCEPGYRKQRYLRGYIQPSTFDRLKAGSAGLSLRVLTQTLEPSPTAPM
jgi:hypothetical protein